MAAELGSPGGGDHCERTPIPIPAPALPLVLSADMNAEDIKQFMAQHEHENGDRPFNTYAASVPSDMNMNLLILKSKSVKSWGDITIVVFNKDEHPSLLFKLKVEAAALRTKPPPPPHTGTKPPTAETAKAALNQAATGPVMTTEEFHAKFNSLRETKGMTVKVNHPSDFDGTGSTLFRRFRDESDLQARLALKGWNLSPLGAPRLKGSPPGIADKDGNLAKHSNFSAARKWVFVVEPFAVRKLESQGTANAGKKPATLDHRAFLSAVSAELKLMNAELKAKQQLFKKPKLPHDEKALAAAQEFEIQELNERHRPELETLAEKTSAAQRKFNELVESDSANASEETDARARYVSFKAQQKGAQTAQADEQSALKARHRIQLAEVRAEKESNREVKRKKMEERAPAAASESARLCAPAATETRDNSTSAPELGPEAQRDNRSSSEGEAQPEVLDAGVTAAQIDVVTEAAATSNSAQTSDPFAGFNWT